MNKMICPHCEKDLTEDISRKLSRDEDIFKFTPGGSKAGIGFAILTCPHCDKILGAVNISPIPIH